MHYTTLLGNILPKYWGAVELELEVVSSSAASAKTDVGHGTNMVAFCFAEVYNIDLAI